jgi:hypothetical protein
VTPAAAAWTPAVCSPRWACDGIDGRRHLDVFWYEFDVTSAGGSGPL